MPYSKDFFAIQLSYAQQLVKKFGNNMDEVLFEYTAFSKNIDWGKRLSGALDPVWQSFIESLQKAEDQAAWVYAYYLAHPPRETALQDREFHGHALFGGFYYEVRDGHLIRPHMVKLVDDRSPHSPISKERMEESLAYLAAMFQHIKDRVAAADTVLGNSWMYNLSAYRRLYPLEYTRHMEESAEHEFQFLSLWGQFFDRHWRVKEHLQNELFQRLEKLEDLESLRFCFPYQILRPRCDIRFFYDFYGIS